jgi:voltage-gated potassium channel
MTVKQLRKIVLEDNTKAGRRFDLFIQIMIIISIISFSMETLPKLSFEVTSILAITEIVMVGIFTIEYLLRVFLTPKPVKFIFSFYGIIDFLSILPFYITTGVDLRSLRAFRLLRLFKLFRYTKSIRRMRQALHLAREELMMFTALALILLYLSATGIYYFEQEAQPEKFSSVFQSLWWAICTLTTVGYGDIYPITAGGKVFTFIILMIGLGMVSIPAGIVASSISKAREMEKEEALKNSKTKNP